MLAIVANLDVCLSLCCELFQSPLSFFVALTIDVPDEFKVLSRDFVGRFSVAAFSANTPATFVGPNCSGFTNK